MRFDVRKADINDFIGIEKLAIEFADVTGYVTKDIGLLINTCFINGFILVCEDENKNIVGFLAGFYSDVALMGGKIFQECAWYVTKEFRGGGHKLFSLMETLCKEDNAVGIIMAAYSNEHMPVVERLYARQGYKDIEHHWLKRLEK